MNKNVLFWVPAILVCVVVVGAVIVVNRIPKPCGHQPAKYVSPTVDTTNLAKEIQLLRDANEDLKVRLNLLDRDARHALKEQGDTSAKVASAVSEVRTQLKELKKQQNKTEVAVKSLKTVVNVLVNTP